MVKLIGSNSRDHIIGFAGSDILLGLGGNDIMVGHAGDDRIYGGDGNDFMDGGPGDDLLEGGSGADSIKSGSGDDTCVGGQSDDYILDYAGADHYFGGSGTDTVSYWQSRPGFSGVVGIRLSLDNSIATKGLAKGDLFFNIENVIGTSSNDTIFGNSAANNFSSSFGRDVLRGRGGNDELDGGDGNDLIDGGKGADTLTGGEGADHFVFRTGDGTIGHGQLPNDWDDMVLDFQNGLDRFDLSGTNANTIQLHYYTQQQSPSGIEGVEVDYGTGHFNGFSGAFFIFGATLGQLSNVDFIGVTIGNIIP